MNIGGNPSISFIENRWACLHSFWSNQILIPKFFYKDLSASPNASASARASASASASANARASANASDSARASAGAKASSSASAYIFPSILLKLYGFLHQFNSIKNEWASSPTSLMKF